MSKFKVTPPIIHVPGFDLWCIDGSAMSYHLNKAKITTPMNLLDGQYYLTDIKGWGKILYDMVFNSSLYKKDKFDCENYALKAMSVCAERYSLNTMGMVIGDTPLGRHGFNVICIYDNANVNLMLWEPNDGFEFSGSPFEIGEYGYQPDIALI